MGAIIGPVARPIIQPVVQYDSGVLPWEQGGGVAPWTPDLLTDLEAWYRGDDVIVSGASVTTWTDKSTNGHDLAQAVAAAQPTLTTRAGQSVLSFDGGDYLQGAFGHSHSQPYTIYVVFEQNAAAGTQVLFDGEVANGPQFFANASTSYVMNAGVNLTGGTPATGIKAACCIYAGASSLGYVGNFTAGGEVMSGDTGAEAQSGITIGANRLVGGPLSGYVWELLICTGAHDAASRKLVGDYFTARYAGLTVTT